MVADGFENHKRMAFASVGELNRHLEETGSQNAYLFTPIHFREQSVGYLVMKTDDFCMIIHIIMTFTARL